MIRHRDGEVRVEPLPNGRHRVTVRLRDPDAFVPCRSWDTSYPPELVEQFVDVKGPAWACDEMRRDEDPTYVEHSLRHGLLAYVAPQDFAGARVLDFGCGSGASLVVLRRMLPGAELVGVDLEERLLALARRRLSHRGIGDVRLERSPSPRELPPGIGTFQFICLSAVYEHLLPEERGPLLSLLWGSLDPGGVLFVNETPHRFSPVESHTTGMPLLNYLPDRLVLAAVRSLSSRERNDVRWEELLRGGIRGGTRAQILRQLRRAGGGRPVLLKPSHLGLQSEVDLWYAKGAPAAKRRAARAAMELVRRMTGVSPVPWLFIAIRKQPSDG